MSDRSGQASTRNVNAAKPPLPPKRKPAEPESTPASDTPKPPTTKTFKMNPTVTEMVKDTTKDILEKKEP